MAVVTSGYSNMLAPLSLIPIRMDCGHFELRVTRWRDAASEKRGFQWAMSACSTCGAHGLPVVPNYPTLEEAQAEAARNPYRRA